MDNDEATVPHGYCRCGCGQRTSLARQGDSRLGYVKGQPVFYVRGHGNRARVQYIAEARGYVTSCWIWQLSRNPDGYGRMSDGTGVQRSAHKVMWERKNGAVPIGLELDHLCRQPACVNPNHLEPVTAAVNVQRSRSAKLTWDDVREIRTRRADGVTLRVLAEHYGVSLATIGHIASGRNWRVPA